MFTTQKSTSPKKFVTLAAVVAILSACAAHPPAPSQTAPAPAQVKTQLPLSVAVTKAEQDQTSPEAAIQRLKDGNSRFEAGTPLQRDLLAQQKLSGVNGQFPFASIVSCIDSRSDPALVFDQGVGDIFVARVAGNVINPDILGSLEYAAKVAGSKAIVVLGHTHCGAVKGACDAVKLGNLTQLITKISPAVKATPNIEGPDRSSKNHHFVDGVAEINTAMAIKEITAKSPLLKDMVNKGQIKIVGAMLDVETGHIEFLPEQLEKAPSKH